MSEMFACKIHVLKTAVNTNSDNQIAFVTLDRQTVYKNKIN
jgi:hypothetical protein